MEKGLEEGDTSGGRLGSLPFFIPERRRRRLRGDLYTFLPRAEVLSLAVSKR